MLNEITNAEPTAGDATAPVVIKIDMVGGKIQNYENVVRHKREDGFLIIYMDSDMDGTVDKSVAVNLTQIISYSVTF